MAMNELNAAIEIAYSAGKMIMKDHFGKKEPVIIKPDTTKLTRADVAANKLILGELERRFPSHSILSEEKTESSADLQRRLRNSHVWTVDPVDGSEELDNQSRDFAVMISYLREGKPYAAAVYLPASDKMYTAARGEGAHLHAPNEGQRFRQIHVTQNNMEKAIITISKKAYDYEQARHLTMKLAVRGFIREGSRGVRICSVAEGRADLTFINDTVKSGEWDTCAPELILQEAGGQGTDYDGQPIAYNKERPTLPKGGIFSNGIIHPNVVPLLWEYAPPK